MLTEYKYFRNNTNSKECLLSFVIELKKRIEEKRYVKVNIPEVIYGEISKSEFKEIFFDQINEIEGFNQYLLEVTIIKTKKTPLKENYDYFEIIEVSKDEV
tara:strand:+ start:104 stop:406 length:303 start_codon:yes stop_codon:yes gene_type:complete